MIFWLAISCVRWEQGTPFISRISSKYKVDNGEYEEIFNAILPVLYDTLNTTDSSEVFMEGTTNIFNYAEYNDIDKAKEIL